MESRLPIRHKYLTEFNNKGKFCHQLHAFLNSDLHSIGAGSLPKNIKFMTNSIVRGRHILQVDEIVNIAAPIKNRFIEKCKDRTLKLHLTDGVQQVIGLEYHYISSFRVNLIPGIKIAVRDVFIRQGILMLCPENVEVLGGSVPRLVAAQERVKTALTKDPRPGSERHNSMKLYSEAELEAWNGDPAFMNSLKENTQNAPNIETATNSTSVNLAVPDLAKKRGEGTLNQTTILARNETIDLC